MWVLWLVQYLNLQFFGKTILWDAVSHSSDTINNKSKWHDSVNHLHVCARRWNNLGEHEKFSKNVTSPISSFNGLSQSKSIRAVIGQFQVC